jgi:hypothetical protein
MLPYLRLSFSSSLLKLDSSDDSLYLRRDTFLVSTLCFSLGGITFLAIGLLGGGLSMSSSESEFDDSEFQVFDLQARLTHQTYDRGSLTLW